MKTLILASDDSLLQQQLSLSLSDIATLAPTTPDPVILARDIRRLKPLLVLVDAGNRGAVGGLVEAARRAEPGLEVLVLGDASNPAAVLDAIRAGAANFFDRRNDHDALRAHLSSRQDAVAVEDRDGGSSFTLVLNGQPGNGENAIALNLALLRARKSTGTLLIDCALPSSEAGAALDLDPSYTMYDAVRDLDRMDRTFVLSAVARYARANLHLLPLVCEANAEEALSPEHFLSVLSTMRSVFPETVLNTGGLRHSPLLAALCQTATDIVLVCEQTYSALRDCKRLLATLPADHRMRQRIVLVVNDYDPAINLDDLQMRDALGLSRVCRLPIQRTELINGLNLGRPFVLESPRSPYVTALEALAGVTPAPDRPMRLVALRGLFANLAGAGAR